MYVITRYSKQNYFVIDNRVQRSGYTVYTTTRRDVLLHVQLGTVNMPQESSISEKQIAIKRKIIKKPTASSSEHNRDSVPEKKSTKMMIQEALLHLKERKGVSYYAINRYIEANYDVDIKKIKHIIKKNLKTGVEVGTIIQTKGTGASGSFKLGKVEKDKSEKAKKKGKTSKATGKIKKTSGGESKKSAEVKKKSVELTKKSSDKMKKPVKVKGTDKSISGKITKMKKVKGDREEKNAKKIKAGTSKDIKTPSKKKSMLMRRKSIGSIIKPPKMKPKAM